MTSGVYRLTFPSGNTYIGKSVNMENRWKQHIDKMRKGTAAVLMQAEWNAYGEFSTEILIPCHSDHIDIVESCCIARLNPELNGDRPADPFPELTLDEICSAFMFFGMSTLQHIQRIGELQSEAELQAAAKAEQEAKIFKLEERRSKEELLADVNDRIIELECALEDHLDEYEELYVEHAEVILNYENVKAELQRINNMSFWKRLFRMT